MSYETWDSIAARITELRACDEGMHGELPLSPDERAELETLELLARL